MKNKTTNLIEGFLNCSGEVGKKRIDHRVLSFLKENWLSLYIYFSLCCVIYVPQIWKEEEMDKECEVRLDESAMKNKSLDYRIQGAVGIYCSYVFTCMPISVTGLPYIYSTNY